MWGITHMRGHFMADSDQQSRDELKNKYEDRLRNAEHWKYQLLLLRMHRRVSEMSATLSQELANQERAAASHCN